MLTLVKTLFSPFATFSEERGIKRMLYFIISLFQTIGERDKFSENVLVANDFSIMV